LGRSSGRSERALLVLAVGALVYANALANGFVWDDRLTAATGPGPLAAMTQRTGAYHRPVVMLSFALERAAWGPSPLAFHATNVVCHVAVAWLVGALAEALGLGAGPALAAALVFVAHPVQTDAVTYVSGRTDVFAALFVLLAFLAWRNARGPADGWAIASAVAVAAAVLAKEAAVLMPLALVVPGAHPAARAPRPWLPIAAAVLWLVGAHRPPIALGDLGARVPAIGVAALGYARLLVWPVDLHLERFVAVRGWSAAATVGVWLVVAALVAALVWVARRTPGGFVLLALAALAYAPVANVVPVYPAIADRALFVPEHFLYLPLVGLAPLAVATVARSCPPRVATGILVVVLAVWAVIVVDRNRDWRDEETLFRHTLAYDPPAARVWYDLANLELARGRLDEARRLYGEALAREPGDAAAHLNLGITLQRQEDRTAAEREYRAAIAADPSMREPYRALAALLAARGETAEAARLWERARAGPGR
jgi:hypothetical protein